MLPLRSKVTEIPTRLIMSNFRFLIALQVVLTCYGFDIPQNYLQRVIPRNQQYFSVRRLSTYRRRSRRAASRRDHQIALRRSRIRRQRRDMFVSQSAFETGVRMAFDHHFDVQAGFGTLTSLHVISKLTGLASRYNIKLERFVKEVEDFGVLYKLLMGGCVFDGHDWYIPSDHVITSLAAFLKFKTSEALFSPKRIKLIYDKANEIFTEVMRPQSLLTCTRQVRKMCEDYNAVRKLPLFKKIYKLGLFMVTHGILDKVGLSMDKLGYEQFEQEVLKKQFTLNADLFINMMETITMVIEKGVQCAITKSIDPIFHSMTAYEDWFLQYKEIIVKSKLLAVSETHGFSYYEFMNQVDHLIDQGKSMVKHACKVGGVDKIYLINYLADLEAARALALTKRSAQQSRSPPFSVLIAGGSSLAKSRFTKILFNYYAKLFNLPTTDEYIYTRYGVDKHWNGLTAAAHTVLLDDIAFLLPKAAPNGDPSLLEMLQVVNDVCFVPPQADLADKGRIPVKARHVIATTNTKHLNAQAYFACPLAIQRRFPWVINLKPKPQYAKFEVMLDGKKLPETPDGEFPNFWEIVVEQVQPKINPGGQQVADLMEVAKFSDINDFLAWYGTQAKEHQELQSKSVACTKAMENINICKDCCYTTKLCKCYTESIASDEDPNYCVWCKHSPCQCYPGSDSEEEEKEQEFPYDPRNDKVLQYMAKNGLGPDDYAKVMGQLYPQSGMMSCDCPYTMCVNSCQFAIRNEQQGNYRYNETNLSEWTSFKTNSEGLIRNCKCPYLCGCEFVKGTVKHAEELAIESPYLSYLRKEKEREFQRKVQMDLDELYLQIPDGENMTWSMWFMIKYFNLYTWSPKVRWVSDWVGYCFATALEVSPNADYIRMKIMGMLGRRISKHLGTYKYLYGTLGTLTTLVTAYKFFYKKNQDMDFESQAKEDMVGGIEKPTYWKHDQYKVTSFDVSRVTASYKGLSSDEVDKIIANNCVIVECRQDDGKVLFNRGLRIKGHYILVNNHAVPDLNEIPMTIHNGNTKGAPVNPTISISVSRHNIYRDLDMDLAMIYTEALPPAKDISDLLAKETLKGPFTGKYIIKENDGSVSFKQFKNMDKANVPHPFIKGNVMNAWCGISQTPTVYGDCGSVALLNTGFGPVIAGIHIMGNRAEGIVSINITKEDVDRCIRNLNKSGIDDAYVVQAGTPVLDGESAADKKTVVEDVPRDSPLRFVETGIGRVFGMFSGWRPKSKSKVVKNVFHTDLIQEGYILNHTRPDMSWKPWFLGMEELKNPNRVFSDAVLRQATDDFILDILQGLPIGWKDELKKLTLQESLNGIPGKQYIDRIQISTSAGAPWRRTKKYLLVGVDKPDLTGIIDINDEVKARVEDIYKKYKCGSRYHPVFTATLKDEPVTFAKAEKGKTRVFAAAPFDWSIVVRQQFLSHVRLIQRNKQLFECGAGTVVQSREWDDLYHYLCKFGENNIVAGDYGKFDKRMSPRFILAAFRILVRLSQEAGRSEEDILAQYCIANDTAYPLYDYNGALVEFFGSNPSGHPLTVIINSLVNSLYMRYCYIILGPERHCRNFKENVNLMTYGDDNIFGTAHSWFNHTAISKTLADMDIEYTMADKESESRPFINIKEASFLKRVWRYDVDLQCYLCPLDHGSINKMLLIGVASGSITELERQIQCMDSACREYFFYGREIYNEKRAMFFRVLKKNKAEFYIQDGFFPTWEELASQFQN